MNNRVCVYADVTTLKHFFMLESQLSLFELLKNDDKRLQSWISFFTLITKWSILTLNCSYNDFLQLISHPFLKYILKSSQGGGCVIQFEPNFHLKLDNLFYDKVISKAPRAIFLLDIDEQIGSQLEESYGLLHVGRSNMEQKIQALCMSFTRSFFESNNRGDWSFLSDISSQIPINSAIIADRYILHNEVLMRENLFEILKCIFPPILSRTEFHLLIFSYSDGKWDLRSRFDEINLFIESLDLPYKVKLGMRNTKLFHDRNIITNYGWYHSGHSFTYFKDGYVNTTTHLFYFGSGFLQDRIESDISQSEALAGKLEPTPLFSSIELLADFKYILTYRLNKYNFYGFIENRLLN